MLCEFPPKRVACSRPGCVPAPTRCVKHLQQQRGCDTCFELLCGAHVISCKYCDEARTSDFFVEDLCEGCFRDKSVHASCATCGLVVCESHFDSMFPCDECGAHCLDCASARTCDPCASIYCGEKCPSCGSIDEFYQRSEE